MKKIDLHAHTNFSVDANFSPEQVIDLALKKQLKVIAITDHNNLKGIKRALEYAKDKEIAVIPGVEISCSENLRLKEIHILGLFIDYENKHLKEFLDNPEKQMVEIIKAIKSSGGISILAHPGLYLREMNRIIKNFIEQGGEGIEIDYPYGKVYNFSKSKVKFLRKKFKRIAKEKRLYISGGSDFHGSVRNVSLGYCGINKKDFKKLRV